MSLFLRVMGIVALCVLGAAARGQFGPPVPSDTGSNAGSSAASPSGGGPLNIAPPPAVPAPGRGAGAGGAAAADAGPLVAVQANQAMTTSAMIGFVNDEPIFINDLFRPLDADLRRLAATSRSRADFTQSANALITNRLSQLISESLVVAAAEKQLTEQDKSRIEMYLALERSRLIADHGGSIPAADRALSATGSSVDQEMADRRRAVIKDLYYQKNLMPHIVITRQMVLDAYEKDPKKWQQAAQVELFTITLPISKWLRETTATGVIGPVQANPTADEIKAAETKALDQAHEIVTKLKGGADFARLVEDYDSRDVARTNGGRKPSVSRGSMVNAQLEDYVFSLPADTLGEPQLLRDPDFRNSTVVVVRVGKKTEARTIPFSEAQAQITTDLRQAQLRELQQQEMDKLARGAAVEAVDRMRDVALDAAVTRYAMK